MKKIIIVGAGKNGLALLNIIGSEYVECFADNSKEKQELDIYGKRVIPTSDLQFIHQNYLLIISPNKYQSILEQLMQYGCTDYIVMANPFMSHFSEKCDFTSLYSPTLINKCGKYYFIVDCWHHRIIYSLELSLPIEQWKVLDDKLYNPHSIAFDGKNYVVDNTDANEILLYEEKNGGFVQTCRLTLFGKPQKVIYSAMLNLYLVLLSENSSIAMVSAENGKLRLVRIISWDVLEGYSKSIKIINDKLFIVAANGIVFSTGINDILEKNFEKYEMHSSLYGMVDIAYWEGNWFVSNYSDVEGNKNPIIAYSSSIQELCDGNYKSIQIENGIPYYFENVEDELYFTCIDTYSALSKIYSDGSEFFVKSVYSCSEITSYDFYKRFTVESIKGDEFIGKVRLLYDYYEGQDNYSDGPIEDKILEACINNCTNQLFENSDSWEVFYHFFDLRRNLLAWINDDKSSDVLEIGAGMGAITPILSEKFNHVDCVELSRKRALINAYRNKESDNVTIYVGNYQTIEPSLAKYDCITLIGVLEYSALYLNSEKPFIHMLELARKHLKKDGRLIIAIENKLGIKYVNGFTEDHTGIPYAGINEYVGVKKIKTFSKVELEQLLSDAGFEDNVFYYPYPDYKMPVDIYSEEYLPLLGDLRNDDEWSCDQKINFNMNTMWDSICKEKIFPSFANSYLVFASIGDGAKEKVVFEKLNYLRHERFAVRSMLAKSDNGLQVVKSPKNKEAVLHVNNLVTNEIKWNVIDPAIPCKPGKIVNEHYYGPFITGERLDNYIYRYRYNPSKVKQIIKEVVNKYYYDARLIPFKETKDFISMFGEYAISDELSYIVTNLDLVFHNIFIDENDKLVCIDCEWVVDFPVPYQFVAWRAIRQLYYTFYDVFTDIFVFSSLCEEIGISVGKQEAFLKMETNFGSYVNDTKMDEITNRYKKNISIR